MKKRHSWPRMAAKLAVALAATACSDAAAQDMGFANVAIISQTMGVYDGRLCTGEFSRGDLGCVSNAPYVSRTSGWLSIGTTTPSATLHVTKGGDSGFNSALNGRTVAAFESNTSNGTTISILAPSTGYSGIYFGDEAAEGPGQLQYVHDGDFFRIGTGGGGAVTSVNVNGKWGLWGVTSAASSTFANPSATLHVSGTIRVADGGEACDINRAGAIKWNGSQFQVCYGSGGWATLMSAAVSGTVVASLDDLTDVSVSTSAGNLFIGTVMGANSGVTNSVAVGQNALGSGSNTGDANTAVGLNASTNNTTGTANAAFGYNSLFRNTTGNFNVAVGASALLGTNGMIGTVGNVAIGYQAGSNIDTGAAANTFVGYRSGVATTTGAGNILIGANVDTPAPTSSFMLNIGNTIYGDLNSKSVGVDTEAPSATLHVSGTALFKTAANTNNCTAAEWGSMRFNDTTKRLQICRQPQ